MSQQDSVHAHLPQSPFAIIDSIRGGLMPFMEDKFVPSRERVYLLYLYHITMPLKCLSLVGLYLSLISRLPAAYQLLITCKYIPFRHTLTSVHDVKYITFWNIYWQNYLGPMVLFKRRGCVGNKS